MSNLRSWTAALFAVFILGIATGSQAGTVLTWPTVSVSGTSSDGALAAEATFTLALGAGGSGDLTIVVTNLENDPGSQGQFLSGFTFKLANSSNVAANPQMPGPTSASGVLFGFNVDSKGHLDGTGTYGFYDNGVAQSIKLGDSQIGTSTDANLPTLTGSTGTWALTASNDLSVFSGPVGDMIVGGPGTGGVYTQTNTSGFNNFLPNVYETATFVVHYNSGLDSTESLSGISFNFGTSPNEHTLTPPGGLPPAGPGIQTNPEPASMAVWGVLGLAFIYARRRRAA